MTDTPIDLRSDTFTKPTPEMRAAMAAAEVGDDVFDEDPSVHALQERISGMLGKEAALFVPSGTMSNQIGLRLHCQPGDEFICETGCHIYNNEQSAHTQLSGIATRTVDGRDYVLKVDQLRGLIRANNDHLVRTKLVCMENTHNRGGGCILPYKPLVEICEWAHENGLATHLDGSRLFNEVVASGIEAEQWARHFDTVSICFSKGLGAPVGSALCGTREQIKRARRHRKVFGGGMRQAGVIAAGALYALEHHVTRMADDHANAQLIGDAVRETEGLALMTEQVESNIVYFEVLSELGDAPTYSRALAQHGVLTLAMGPKHVRAVTHLDVSQAQAARAAEILNEVAADLAGGASELATKS